MSKRITLISSLKESYLKRIAEFIPNQFGACKVPFGNYDKRKFDIDNLPYHITIFATNKENQEEFINLIKTVTTSKIKLKVNKVEIMKGKFDSYVLYLGIEAQDKIKKLQKVFYDKFLDEHYNPNNYVFHITLHIDKDFEKVKKLQKIILEKFIPFYLEFDKVALFDYPGEEIKKFSLSK